MALGGNRWQTLTKVIIPAACSGISTGIILGMSRAVGGDYDSLNGYRCRNHTYFLFKPVQPMTSTIAAEMGETVVGSTHYHSLFQDWLNFISDYIAV